MSKQAAQFLIDLKTRLGKSVPTYAKEIVAGQRESGERASNELFVVLNQMRSTKREEIFKSTPDLKAWYDKYRADNKDSVAVVVSNIADVNEADRYYRGMAR